MVSRSVFLVGVVSVLLALPFSAWPGGQRERAERAREPVQLEVTFVGPEREAMYEEIWALYMEQNPHVEINLLLVEDAAIPAIEARIAAGDPPDMAQRWFNTNQFNYTNFVNLLEVDFPYWERITYDVAGAWETAFGIEDYVPGINIWQPPLSSFIYHADEMSKTGLNPRDTVRSMAALKAFLAKLKAYIDSRSDLSYVFDEGWHILWAELWPTMFVHALGHSPQELDELYLGRIRWDDMSNNPFVDYFRLFKDFYDRGIMPDKWSQRDWSAEYEAGFIGKKSIFTFHGPWLFDKVFAQDPSAKLSGFPLPVTNGVLPATWSINPAQGATSIFAGNEDKPAFAETLTAFNWWLSPDTVKKVAEAIGWSPAMDMSDVGVPDLRTPYYSEIVKPAIEGYFGEGSLVLDLHGSALVKKYQKKGTPNVLGENMVKNYLEYLEGRMSLEAMMKQLQERWEAAYDIP
jgi:ABC-type glycerol-3-phosphate transport system substrate-binding protein